MERHIVFTNGRSGSNYIAGLINRHPQLVNYGEVLGEWTIPYKFYRLTSFLNVPVSNYLNHIYSSPGIFYGAQVYSAIRHVRKLKKANFKSLQSIKSIGVKDFSMNFVRRNARNYLKDNPDIRVINLYRENHLERYVSYLSLQQSGIISVDRKSSQSAQVRNLKIKIPIEKAIMDLNRIEHETVEQLTIIQELPESQVYSIRYEDLFSSEEEKLSILSGMFQFLGVESIEIKDPSKKILTRKLKDLISNYDDFFNILIGTKYEKYIGL